MTQETKKELEGRYAAKVIHSADTNYDFTEPKYKRYDALATGYSQEEGMLCELLEEFKTYNDPRHKRYMNGTEKKRYGDFQLDYDKCGAMVQESEKDNRIPLLECFFWDYVVAWDLNRTDWKKGANMVPVNKHGTRYDEEREVSLQSHLPLDGDQGPVFKIRMENPEEFWQRIAELIKKDYPDYTPSWQ